MAACITNIGKRIHMIQTMTLGGMDFTSLKKKQDVFFKDET